MAQFASDALAIVNFVVSSSESNRFISCYHKGEKKKSSNQLIWYFYSYIVLLSYSLY